VKLLHAADSFHKMGSFPWTKECHAGPN
jgi:hypothetical protein